MKRLAISLLVLIKDFKLKDVMQADEAFVTGTFAGIVGVNQINRKKFKINKDNLTYKLSQYYLDLINK